MPLIIFFYLYKTVDPKDTQHPLLQFVGSAGGVDNNNILGGNHRSHAFHVSGLWRVVCHAKIPFR